MDTNVTASATGPAAKTHFHALFADSGRGGAAAPELGGAARETLISSRYRSEISRAGRRHSGLKVETDRCRQRARGNEMRPAKSGQEVVERDLVGQVDGRKAKAPLPFFAVEQVVVTHGQVEQIARRDARRIVVVVLGAGGWNLDVFGPVLRRGHNPLGLIELVGVA